MDPQNHEPPGISICELTKLVIRTIHTDELITHIRT
jgi:hypothetical protein